jgi:hypothetical protein
MISHADAELALECRAEGADVTHYDVARWSEYERALVLDWLRQRERGHEAARAPVFLRALEEPEPREEQSSRGLFVALAIGGMFWVLLVYLWYRGTP